MSGPRVNSYPRRTLPFLYLAILCGTLGCRAVSPLPPVNFNAPGWSLHQGQAVWRLPRGSQEIAGEVLVATGPDEQAFVQFSKVPFPLVIARAASNRWEIEFPPQNKHYAGHGQPPKRLMWLYLARVLAGEPPPRNWRWRETSADWRLENPATGESLSGYFGQ